MGEAIRAGLADEDAADGDTAGLSSAEPEPGGAAEPEPGEAAGTSGDMFNPDAVGELAGAAEGAAAAPF